MRTNIAVDEKLLRRGMQLTRCKTKHEVVNLSLVELVRRKERKKILQLAGKVIWDGNLAALRGDSE